MFCLSGSLKFSKAANSLYVYSNRKVWAVLAVFAEQNVMVNAIAKLYVTKSFTKGWNW